MDKPICRLCGAKHYSQEAHVINISFGVEQPVEVAPIVEERPPKKDRASVKRWDRESWNSYMREYMRERRARAKA